MLADEVYGKADDQTEGGGADQPRPRCASGRFARTKSSTQLRCRALMTLPGRLAQRS